MLKTDHLIKLIRLFPHEKIRLVLKKEFMIGSWFNNVNQNIMKTKLFFQNIVA